MNPPQARAGRRRLVFPPCLTGVACQVLPMRSREAARVSAKPTVG
ncbi:hypothetical protein [Mesorhizobium sp. NBSH29]|nr:hypothetical protein [Mesorhizobium sp. NBSH29]